MPADDEQAERALGTTTQAPMRCVTGAEYPERSSDATGQSLFGGRRKKA